MDDEIVPLISVSEEGKLELCDETLEWLKTITHPFGIITCAGVFRTGKSFLLNRILDSKPGKGFGVGETVQACTKGLWICKKKINASDNLDVFVMDTEGIDALDASTDHDTRIFSLGVLLSSIFLYNSMGHIDEKSIQTLSFMSNVSEYIDSDVTPPKFYWLLRDFSLQMTDKNGKHLSNQEYLEQSLDESLDSKTDTRKCIKSLFKNRSLFTLPRPCTTDSAQNLNLKHSNLNPKFMSKMASFREEILNNALPICADTKPMSGTMFVEMCKILLEKVLNSQMPVMKDAWSMLREIQHNDLYRKYISLLKHELESLENDTLKNLEKKAVAIKKKYIDYFTSNAMKPEESEIFSLYREDLSNSLQVKINEKKINMEEVCKTSINLIDFGSIESIGNSLNAFVAEYGEYTTCNMWFNMFMVKLELFRNSEKDIYEQKGKNDTKQFYELQLQEWQSKYENAMISLEHEREEIMRLRVELVSKEEEKCLVACTEMSTMTYETFSETVEPNYKKDEELVELEEKYKEATENLEYMQHSIKNYKEQIDILKSRIENDVKELKTDFSKKVKEFEEKIIDEKNKYTTLSGKLELLKDKSLKQDEDLKKSDEKSSNLHLKFMEFHKNTLEDIRKKEAQEREQSSILTSEILDINKKLQEEKKRIAVSENENLHLKRQLEDYESIHQELKRTKREYLDVNIEKTRKETDLSNVKIRFDEITKERDVLRKENMKLENKLVILETTSLLNDVKQNISN